MNNYCNNIYCAKFQPWQRQQHQIHDEDNIDASASATTSNIVEIINNTNNSNRNKERIEEEYVVSNYNQENLIPVKSKHSPNRMAISVIANKFNWFF
jgi:hypothetical protein